MKKYLPLLIVLLTLVTAILVVQLRQPKLEPLPPGMIEIPQIQTQVTSITVPRHYMGIVTFVLDPLFEENYLSQSFVDISAISIICDQGDMWILDQYKNNIGPVVYFPGLMYNKMKLMVHNKCLDPPCNCTIKYSLYINKYTDEIVPALYNITLN